jgi:hypothetical protein
MPSNDCKLNRSQQVSPKSRQNTSWRSGECRVSVMTREQAGVDGDEPWIASCDDHGEMITCSTRSSAV